MSARKASGSRRRKFRVGDRARYDTPTWRWTVQLVEDRGKLGVGGGRIWRIRTLTSSPGAESVYEVPENELKPIRARAKINGRS